MKIVNASRKHARELAYLFDIASSGISSYIWGGMTRDGESPLDVGEKIASKERKGLSYVNARILLQNEMLSGAIISHQKSGEGSSSLTKIPEILRPIFELETLAPHSWYINAVATYEKFRGVGIASALIADAETRALADGCNCMSLIVSSENVNAKRLYVQLGFKELSTRAVVPWAGGLTGGQWILMEKTI